MVKQAESEDGAKSKNFGLVCSLYIKKAFPNTNEQARVVTIFKFIATSI